MRYEFSFEWTKPLIFYVTNRFWVRYISWHGFLAFALLLALSIYLVVIGETRWYAGVCWSLVMLSFLMSVFGYLVYIRRGLAKLRGYPNLKVDYRFEDDGFSTNTNDGHSFLKWTLIKDVWRFEKAWLLFVSQGQYLTLPALDLSDDLKQFISGKITANGGRIR